MPRWGNGLAGLALAALALSGLGTPACAADAIATPGAGKLIMCRDWLVYTSCWHYSHVPIPPRVKLGDNLDLVFGSNNKSMNFAVARILQTGDRCDIYNTAEGAIRKVSRIRVEPCKPAAQ